MADIQVTPFINATGDVAYEIAIDDDFDTRELVVTESELPELVDKLVEAQNTELGDRLE